MSRKTLIAQIVAAARVRHFATATADKYNPKGFLRSLSSELVGVDVLGECIRGNVTAAQSATNTIVKGVRAVIHSWFGGDISDFDVSVSVARDMESAKVVITVTDKNLSSRIGMTSAAFAVEISDSGNVQKVKLGKATAKHAHAAIVVTAGPQDAWGVDWDCNTDACDVEEIYRRNGRSIKVLEKVLDHPNATPNGIRAACYLLWRDYEKKAPPEIARKAYDAFRFIKDDRSWIQQLAKLGNIRAKLEMEMDRVKAVLRNCGSLDSVLEEAEQKIRQSRSLGTRHAYAMPVEATALQHELVTAHASTGATLDFVPGHRNRQ